ncbi:putative bifunctional diguanylate cyclase/phosphodiesterase [Robertmurraya korlensis]|uniref:putative bifunctional diguanylate cyclase/phosphodiesterase n=1 Tax=Robertmurraya korlensis TaxID=519977 RepID=UPI0008269A9A|nr:EAL domain-containing protein [Robertmurraya korlensis]
MFTVPNSAFILESDYTFSLVFLSIVIACSASYTALSLNERIQHNSFFHRFIWIGLASVAMGFGIWSMHFIGMGALNLPFDMQYDPFLTLLSIFPALTASLLAFYIANRQNQSIIAFIFSGVIMGLGISAMHYMGMAAMEMEVKHAYNLGTFVASILIAMTVSFVALYIFSSLQRLMNRRVIKMITSLIMGLAVSSMHYTGMASVVFYVDADIAIPTNHSHSTHTWVLVIAVAIGTFVLLILSSLSGALDRYVDYRMNFFDPLTKLPNRRQFEKAIHQFLHANTIAILHIHDLEKWNIGYGYKFGDRILTEVSQLLLKLKSTSLEIYRVEGNRFAFICKEDTNEQLKTTLERISSILKVPLQLDDHTVLVNTVSALAVKERNETANQLYANAVAVLHHPSIEYQNQIIEYNPKIHTYNFEQRLLSDIDTAMENNHLYIVYQPKINASSHEILGVEALIRWNHPVHGFLSPGLFIPVLERSGKMFDVTDWVIAKVCQQLDQWNKEGQPVRHIAINIPGTYITSARLLKTLNNCVDKYAILAKNLELEITETSVVSDIENAIRAVGEIRKQGFSVALDDFGTGVSSLSYLKRLPISTLKIDKSFVDGVPECKKESAIITAIVSLCHSLDIETVVEGVENVKQVNYLTSMPKIPTIQGFYFAKPMKQEELITWMKQFHSHRNELSNSI